MLCAIEIKLCKKKMLKKYTKVTMEEYEQWFTLNDFNLPQGKHNSIIAQSHFSAEIKDFLDLESIHGRLANGDPTSFDIAVLSSIDITKTLAVRV